jgi:hypothetical protein
MVRVEAARNMHVPPAGAELFIVWGEITLARQSIMPIIQRSRQASLGGVSEALCVEMEARLTRATVAMRQKMIHDEDRMKDEMQNVLGNINLELHARSRRPLPPAGHGMKRWAAKGRAFHRHHIHERLLEEVIACDAATRRAWERLFVLYDELAKPVEARGSPLTDLERKWPARQR